MYDLALIGNCQISALIRHDSSIVWLSMPRPDTEPVFGELLDPDGGSLNVVSDVPITQQSVSYFSNTAVLHQNYKCGDESAYSITDFAPRFEQYGRIYRPAALFRIIRPEKASPRLRIHSQPTGGWSKEPLRALRFNSHLRYEHPQGTLRLATNMPLTYLQEGKSFLLESPVYVALLWDMPLEDDIKRVSEDFLERTIHYWQTWVKHCSVPTLFQDEVIRSAITLKLHCYEDTGAILAATTTSLPERIGGERNWDYRHCWLRDSFFSLSAFNNLGHFEEMEGFLRFLINIVRFDSPLGPVYSLDQSLPLPEVHHENWRGYEGSIPVRSGNAAATQIQNDVYGELILTLAPIYLDERFISLRSPYLNDIMKWLASRCIASIGQRDAGLWELRQSQLEHSFTNLMCWAGLDRMILVWQRSALFKDTPQLNLGILTQERDRAMLQVQKAVRQGIVWTAQGFEALDASLLLLPILRFPDAQVNAATVDAIAEQLAAQRFGPEQKTQLLYRYIHPDDFGRPQEAFLFCSFWLAQAYARLQRKEDGRQLLSSLKSCQNQLGLMAEHIQLGSPLRASGNFPQTYSHVGLINAAFAVSPPWENVW